MSVTGVFASGKASGHPGATSILKYIPRARVPWQPSRFGRANLEEKDLARLWGMGRYRTGPGNYNSGYSTDKTKVLEDHSVSLIPKHELEKYMPDISLGGKALVTPVSLMSARNGHRVTHDMIHSYDPFIGRVGAPAVVDHSAVSPLDPNRVGLNAATLDCRGRIHRWLRRGPFFQEDQYFRRSGVGVSRAAGGAVAESAHEAPLMASIVRLARRGHLKAACEEYRRATTVPPVAVYRALTAACVPGRHLADAVAILEDGNAKLFYVARDGEVLHNVMRCAVAAGHRARVVWVYNLMRGRHYENVVVRAEVEPVWRYRIAAAALAFLLDTHAEAEAAAVYAYLAEEGMLDGDRHVLAGLEMRRALAEGKPVPAVSAAALDSLTVSQNAAAVTPEVARALYQRHRADMAAEWGVGEEETQEEHNSSGRRRNNSGTAAAAALMQDPSGLSAAAAAGWMRQHFPDVDTAAVMRLARFSSKAHSQGQTDLMATARDAYVERAALWIEQLSAAHHARAEAPLPYLLKSRPSLVGNKDSNSAKDATSKVRVAYVPQRRPPHSLLAAEEGFRFFYTPGTRMVEETFAHIGEQTLEARLLAQTPVHTEVPVATDALAALDANINTNNNNNNNGYRLADGAARVLHPSVLAAANSRNSNNNNNNNNNRSPAAGAEGRSARFSAADDAHGDSEQF